MLLVRELIVLGAHGLLVGLGMSDGEQIRCRRLRLWRRRLGIWPEEEQIRVPVVGNSPGLSENCTGGELWKTHVRE
jgi:hypothetical protein